MRDPIESSERRPFNYFRIAWRSALAAGICLGLPIALMFWVLVLSKLPPSASIHNVLVLLQDTWFPFANPSQPSTPVHDFLMTLQMYVTPASIALTLGVLSWSLLLGRISGYRKWSWIALAGMAGVFIGQAPIGLLDERLQQPFYGWPVHMRFALFLTLSVFCVAASTGLALGLLVRSWKASLMLAAGSGLASAMAVIAVDIILDILGLRVGRGNLAMPKVTAVGTLAAAIAGGMVLGVLFSRYYFKRNYD